MADTPRVSEEAIVMALHSRWRFHDFDFQYMAQDLQDAREELKAFLDASDDIAGMHNMEARLRKKYGWTP